MKNKKVVVNFLLLLILVFLTSGCSSIRNIKWCEDWDKVDYALLGVSTIAQGIDWRQTRQAMGRTDVIYFETNPILGSRPSKDSVDLYFAISFATKVGVAYLLPSDLRKVWLGGWTVMNGYNVDKNRSHGLSISW